MITFNNGDISYSSYQNLYIVEAGTTMQVEAMPDADGLKVAIITGVIRESQEMVYQLFKVKNETEFGISSIQGEVLKTFGGRCLGYHVATSDRRSPQYSYFLHSFIPFLTNRCFIIFVFYRG